MVPCKKNAKRLGAHIVFIDESGFLLIPTILRTWAPRGKTPIIRHRYKRDKVSVISGVSVSPQRIRFGLYFQMHLDNIGQIEVCHFLKHLLRHLRGNVIAILDNSNTHKGNLIAELQKRNPRIAIEYFPSYAPQLNPDEGVWSYSKRSLANGRPDNLEDLLQTVADSLMKISKSQSILRGCVEHSELPFRLP
jgi:transposase